MAFANLGFEDEDPAASGLPDGWTVAVVQTGSRRVGFGFGNSPPVSDAPYEAFKGGWSSNQSYLFVFVGVGTDLSTAIYDNAGTPQGLEDFEELWDSNENYIFVFVSTTAAFFDGLAFLSSALAPPFAIAPGATLSLTTESGGPASSAAIAGTKAVVVGSGGTFPTLFPGGVEHEFRLRVDDEFAIVVDLGDAQTLADVIARINLATTLQLGFVVAANNGGQVEISSPRIGNGALIELEDVQAARSIATNPAPYALVNGQDLDVEIDGGAPQTITFLTAQFAAIGAATAQEVADAINTTLVGGTAVAVFGIVRILSDTIGAGSSVEVTGGTAVALGFPTTLYKGPLGQVGLTPGLTQGTGNVRDTQAITAEELVSIVNASAAIIAIGAELRHVSNGVGGLRAYSKNDITGTIQVNASAIATGVGFPVASPAGPVGVAAESVEDFEDSWSNTPYADDAGDLTLTAANYAPLNIPREPFEDGWRSNQDFVFVFVGPPTDLEVNSYFEPGPATNQAERFHAIGLDFGFTANPGTDVFTAPGHPLTNGDVVTVRNEGGQLPDGLNIATNYFVINTTANTFQLSPTGVGAVDITSAGAGTHFVHRDPTYYWTRQLVI